MHPWQACTPKARTLAKLLTSATTYSDHTAQNLTRSAITNTSSTLTSAAQVVTLNNYIQVVPNAAYSSSSSSSFSKPPSNQLEVQSIRIDTSASSNSDDLRDSEVACDYDDLLALSWVPTVSRSTTSKVSQRMKQKRLLKSAAEDNRFLKLIRLCTHGLGADAAIEFFGKVGRELGVKEYNVMLEICIEKAKNTDDEDIALKECHRVFESMREHGFEIGEETYGPFLMFIIDMGMVEQFHFFCKNIKKENPNSVIRLAYYEMLLWIKVNDRDKMQMLIANTHGIDESKFNDSYLAALCEGDRQEEVSMLLETIDIKKVSSKESMESIFKSLGRLSLESHARKFILELKTHGQGGHDLSNLIYSYAMSIPNILIEDIVIKFKNLQAELKVASSSLPYEKLIKICCDSREVHLAIDLVESMFEKGLNVRMNTLNSILTTCSTIREYNLVHCINSMIINHNMNPEC